MNERCNKNTMKKVIVYKIARKISERIVIRKHRNISGAINANMDYFTDNNLDVDKNSNKRIFTKIFCPYFVITRLRLKLRTHAKVGRESRHHLVSR